MRRNRYQKRNIKKRCGKWIGQWWESGTRHNRLLGPVSTMRESEARAKLDTILAPINQEQAPRSGEQRLREFVEGTYYQFLFTQVEEVDGNGVNRIKTHSLSAFGSRR